jgi:hypothetical protein
MDDNIDEKIIELRAAKFKFSDDSNSISSAFQSHHEKNLRCLVSRICSFEAPCDGVCRLTTPNVLFYVIKFVVVASCLSVNNCAKLYLLHIQA